MSISKLPLHHRRFGALHRFIYRLFTATDPDSKKGIDISASTGYITSEAYRTFKGTPSPMDVVRSYQSEGPTKYYGGTIPVAGVVSMSLGGYESDGWTSSVATVNVGPNLKVPSIAGSSSEITFTYIQGSLSVPKTGEPYYWKDKRAQQSLGQRDASGAGVSFAGYAFD